MTETKRNHYSPRFANRPWANQSGLMFKYAKSTAAQLSKTKTGPTEWGQESGLYPQELENAFAKLESIIAPIYRCFLENKPLDLRQRLLWSHWLLCQYSRTPSFIIDFAKINEDLLTQIPDSELLASEINTEEKLEMALDNIVNTESSKKLIPFLAVRDWIICEAAPGCCFLRTDAPVVIAGPLVREKTQILYPLSPEKCFVATVLGKFPPSACLVTHSLSQEKSIEILKFTASRADREVVVHPYNDTEELRSMLNGIVGVAAGYFKIGGVPDLRHE